MPTAWQLMEHGDFEVAYQRLTEEMSSSPGRMSAHLYNRGLCLLNLNRPNEALIEFERLIEDRPDTDAGYIAAGTTLWCLGRRSDAVETWTRSLETLYTDAAGGVQVPALLFFAGSRLPNPDLERESIRLLQRRLKARRAGAWPGPIAAFIVGDLDEAGLLSKAGQPSSTRHVRKLTKASFWVGLSYYRGGDVRTYRYWMNQAATGHILEPECYLAKHELVDPSMQMP